MTNIDQMITAGQILSALIAIIITLVLIGHEYRKQHQQRGNR